MSWHKSHLAFSSTRRPTESLKCCPQPTPGMPTRGPARAPAPGDVLLGYEICQPEVPEHYHHHFCTWLIPFQQLLHLKRPPVPQAVKPAQDLMPIHEPDLDQSSYVEHSHIFAACLMQHLISLMELQPGNTALQCPWVFLHNMSDTVLLLR